MAQALSLFYFASLAHGLHPNKAGKMDITNIISDTLTRLPLFYSLSDENIDYIFSTIDKFMKRNFI